ncbi:LPS assembly lipoprotein LptE [Sulfurovum sp. TSL1]|uniref:LPS assembly lipoprotein LptE n=1 Tax=Sulfurovum sp. TSL1 TaxID=2826994 RepID=UPI001CC645FA|nr:hypothetical protein [Sulfurovum sp. TSL1]GIT98561.1 lipoprotein [Sulfurovum sp. TSL1]
MRMILKFWMTVSILLLVSACGYKPSSHMIQHVFSDTVYVEVSVDRAEPENAPYVKDEMNRLVYTRFKGRIVSKEEAQSKIRLSYAGSTFIPLSYENGYVTRYRAVIRVKFYMVTKEGRERKTISSIVESDIQESSLTSSALRIEALRLGLGKALDEFLAYVSAKGMLKETK